MVNPDAEAKKEAGNKAFASKDYDTAISLYTEAIAFDPKNHVYFSNRSACRGGKGQWDEAASDARECLRLNPNFLKGYYRLAAAQIELGEFEGAGVTVRSGLRADPDNRQLQGQLRLVRAKQGAKAEAGRAQEKAAGAGGPIGSASSDVASRLKDPAAQKEFLDLQEQFENSRREYQKVKMEQTQRQHERRRNELTKSELEETSMGESSREDGKMYRSIGKMFLRTSREDIFAHIEKEIAEDTKKEKEFGGKTEFLEKRMRSQQQNIQELVKAH